MLVMVQLDSRRNLANLERNGVKVADLLSEVMLYTYCNDEPFYPPQVGCSWLPFHILLTYLIVREVS